MNRAEKNAYEQRRRAAIKTGKPTSSLVDAEPARQHVASLRAQGMSFRRIVDASGVAPHTVGYLVYGIPRRGLPPARRIHVMNAKRILAVQFNLDVLAPAALIDGTGTRRRIQGLIARGWTNRELAAEAGISWPGLYRVLRAERVQVSTYRLMVEVHSRLWDREPPQDTPKQRRWVAASKRRAVENGWVPSSAWDDIDDPDDVPHIPEAETGLVDEVAVRRVISGHADPSVLTQAERLAALRRMVGQGDSVKKAATTLRMGYDSARKAAAA